MGVDRKEEGRKIAFEQTDRLRMDDPHWYVRGKGGDEYVVDLFSGGCTCPDKMWRHDDNPAHRCKHWWAVWFKAPEPVTYDVRILKNDMWVVALRRVGVRLVDFGPYLSRREAELAKSIMEEPSKVAV